MTSGSQVSNKVDVNFLVDQPSDTDFFGSHSKVADAVADAIGKPGATNVIGLLGGWGSGKSTVVRQMASWLKTKPCGANKHLFTYDAWLHQNDPPRRAFLEELIGELTAAKLVLYSNLEENAGLRQARQNAMPKIPVSLAPSDLFGMLVKVVATNRPAIRSDKSTKDMTAEFDRMLADEAHAEDLPSKVRMAASKLSILYKDTQKFDWETLVQGPSTPSRHRYSIGKTSFYREVAASRIRIRKFGTATRIARRDAEAWAESLPVIEGGAA